MERLIDHRTPPVLADLIRRTAAPALRTHDDAVVTAVCVSQSERFATVIVTVDAEGLTEDEAAAVAWELHDDLAHAGRGWHDNNPDDTVGTTGPAKVRPRAYAFVVAVSGTIAQEEVPA